ncbi:Formate/nitrite transporter-domain-containing protein [Dipodascopsis uninucleata]
MSATRDHISAEEAALLLLHAGITKVNQRLDHSILKNFVGGALVSVGGLVTLLVKGGCDGLNETNPAAVQLLLGLVFPVGLAMATLTGGELSTGNVLFFIIAVLQRRVPIWRACLSFIVSFFANLAGSLFYLLIAHYGHILSAEPYLAGTIIFADDKVNLPSGSTVFVRAIGCNWLICMGVFMAFLSRTVVSRVISIWIPIFTFVAVGFENSVANMFLVPIGMINGADISVGKFIWKSLILSTLGNIIGGGFFVGVIYWYLYVYPQEQARDVLSEKSGEPILPICEPTSGPDVSRIHSRIGNSAETDDDFAMRDRKAPAESIDHTSSSKSTQMPYDITKQE